MKAAGFFLAITGWLLVLAALAMLPAGVARNIFAMAGVAVEVAGIAIVARTHMPPGVRKPGSTGLSD
ncbi:MAG TPA: hypothetical protein VG273_17295 [Bryobacteraceae bacterium]|jgi:hypothetical protein|nr:hypothetical protein [Bryobacteraceae bacterium]